MFKTILMVAVVVVSGVAHAKKPKEMTDADYKNALACLDKLNSSNPYKWTSGSSPYTYDEATRDHFIVLGRENAFVRFGSTSPERCGFKMIHDRVRDCVQISDESGAEIVTMKYVYPDPAKVACDKRNLNSTTKYKYNSAETCTKISNQDLKSILQKQILTNTEKLIVEKKMSRQDFDATFRSSCESVHNKLWDGVGMDFGAVVSNAVNKVQAAPAVSDAYKASDIESTPAGEDEGVAPAVKK